MKYKKRPMRPWVGCYKTCITEGDMVMNNTKKPPIEIDVTQSMRHHSTELRSQIYLDELNQILKIIYDHSFKDKQEHQDYSQKKDDDITWQNDREYFNITILGTRGSGKTTLLLTVFQLINNLERDVGLPGVYGSYLSAYRDLHCAVHKKKFNKPIIGGIIEPSHMESHENMAINIFSLLLHKAQEYLLANPPKDPCQIRNAEELIRLSEEINANLPILFSKDRLERAFENSGTEGLYDEIINFRSGSTLERKMSEFIEKMLELMSGQLVVIGIDDVDLVCNHGENALESLRCYFTSPKVLFLIAGDLRLFKDVMTGSFNRKLQRIHKPPLVDLKSVHGHENDPEFVTDLVQQYLKKVLPIQYRIFLEPDLQNFQENIRLVNPEINDPDHQINFQALLIKMIDKLCLTDSKSSDQKKTDTYQCLIPSDLRRFISFCWMVLRKDETKLLHRLAHLWNSVLQVYGIDSKVIGYIAHPQHFGRRILNLMIRHKMLDDQVLRLDNRTDEEQLNIAITFIRIMMETIIRKDSAPEFLSILLDYCIPAYYLTRFPEENRIQIYKDFQLEILDSRRRLYTRITTRIGREEWISPGIVRICHRLGALEKMLDIQSNRNSSVWNSLLSQFKLPISTDTTSLEHESSNAIKWCREFLEDSETKDACSIKRSGYRWSTEYLPSIQNEQKAKHLAERQNHKRSPAEMITTPDIFCNLAGALPRTIFKFWTITEGDRTYLSFWKGLCLIQKNIEALYELDKKTKVMAVSKDDIEITIINASKSYLDREGGSSPSRYTETRDPARVVHQRAFPVDHTALYQSWLKSCISIHDYRWKSAELYISDYKSTKSTVFWYPEDELIYGITEQSSNDHKENSKNDNKRRPIGKLISSGIDLEKCRTLAMDQTIRRFAKCMAEWAQLWIFPSKGSSGPQGSDQPPVIFNLTDINLAEIQSTISSFIEDLDNDVSYCENWSGLGDILQRWICNFLNSVLIETISLKSPIKSEPSQSAYPSKPKLLRSTSIKSPPRNTSGSVHPLFSNLEILTNDAFWQPSSLFFFLFSCPVFSILLPEVCKVENVPLGASVNTDKRMRINYEYGNMMLYPNASLDNYRSDATFALDLAGLSWRGLDLCIDKKAITGIDARRDALVEMMNSMMADVEPSQESKPYLSYLAAIVYGAIKPEEPVDSAKHSEPSKIPENPSKQN